jgi:hypothetical protein
MPTRDEQLDQILSRLTDIAEALTSGSTVPPRTPASLEQTQTIVDYLVLREVVGRQADETSRVVSAVRRTGGKIAFPDVPPITDDTQVAVFTARGTPAEIRPLDPTGPNVPVTKRGGTPPPPERTITLQVVQDNQPIIRIEIRDGENQTVALGPRLAAVA